MLTFFIDPYEEEMISSLFARYHFYNGNIDKNDTIEELLGERNITAFKMFPSRLNYLETQVENPKYKADYFIYKHTIFPVHSVFLTKEKQSTVINYMKEKGSDKVNLVLGISTSKLDVRKGYRYCPLCVEEEINKHGEAYFHRMHQIQGVLVCEKHECTLIDYVEKYKSEIEFTRLRYENILLNNKILFYDEDLNDKLVKIAKAIKFVINTEYLRYSKENIVDKLYKYLDKKGYLTQSRIIRQDKLSLDLKYYYGENIFNILNLKINKGGNYWVRSIFSKSRASLNPVETILLILFLSNSDIEEFFQYEDDETLPFGNGPWPCLNPVCSNYKKNVINKIKIENAYRSRLPNGIFRCEVCGYTYRRKGPDKLESDIYRIDKVLEFGLVWKSEFEKAIERKEKKKDIIKRFRVYEKFVDYYKKNGLFITRSYSTRLGCTEEHFEEYTNDIREYIKEHHGCNKSKVQKEMGKQVGWLIYNYPEWLVENLPKAQKYKSYSKGNDYKKIDEELLEKVNSIYNELIKAKTPRRITITFIERVLNEKINRKLDKLPKTKALVDTVLENVDQYSIRRVTEYCNGLINENKCIARHEVIIKTAISYSLISDECKKDIDIIIENYHNRVLNSNYK